MCVVVAYPSKCVDGIPDKPNIRFAVPESKERFVSCLLEARIASESAEQAKLENQGSCTSSAWYDHHRRVSREVWGDIQVSAVSLRTSPCRKLVYMLISA